MKRKDFSREMKEKPSAGSCKRSAARGPEGERQGGGMELLRKVGKTAMCFESDKKVAVEYGKNPVTDTIYVQDKQITWCVSAF